MGSIRLKGVIMEDFVNYKVPSMFLITSYCNWKCCKEANIDITVCQNQSLAKQDIKEFNYETLLKAYQKNNISQAIVVGGLEPFEQSDELIGLVKYFRDNKCTDTFVIYTGYYPNEILSQIDKLKPLGNIIIKFGRYIPNHNPHYDNVLGIYLASDNQYGEMISDG